MEMGPRIEQEKGKIIVERDCVCDIVAHLPIFLSCHLHHCNVLVSEVYKVTFTCGGRLRP
ncbi:zinc transporter 7-B [Gossypium australe]|uniref:Zinc transporter 7-B n=1 Tax=Gossypium australe TaxID=47621 RepID=A0A5B6VPR3_9ROSI|nr:zinc transporter 7-B [Gossypium australe]